MNLQISSEFYAKKAVEDCVYWLSEKYTINIKVDGSSYDIYCSNPDNDFEHLFHRTLNDFNLRESINARTSNIKDLIIAKAFYPDMVEIEPVGKFDDPVLMDRKDETK